MTKFWIAYMQSVGTNAFTARRYDSTHAVHCLTLCNLCSVHNPFTSTKMAAAWMSANSDTH